MGRKVRYNGKEAKAILGRATQATLCGGESPYTTIEEIREAYPKSPWFELFANPDGTAYLRTAGAGWDLN